MSIALYPSNKARFSGKYEINEAFNLERMYSSTQLAYVLTIKFTLDSRHKFDDNTNITV